VIKLRISQSIATAKQDAGNGVETTTNLQQSKTISIKKLMENGVSRLFKIPAKLEMIAKKKLSV
jgi:hypothetical protein